MNIFRALDKETTDTYADDRAISGSISPGRDPWSGNPDTDKYWAKEDRGDWQYLLPQFTD